jgi:hypothetical protein
MEVVAAICDPDQARRYLRHIGEDYEPPAACSAPVFPAAVGGVYPSGRDS